MSGRVRHVAFLCTGNSARSILGESLLEQLGGGRFRGHSAGSHPTGRVHPLALEVLRARGHDTTGLRSKGWDELAAPGAPELDLVFTVCDAAEDERCPAWPGRPATAHWGLPDPAAVVGPEDVQRAAFLRTYEALEGRIRRLIALPIDALDPETLRSRLDEIGRTSDGGTS